ncbi:MAG TPA: hypothetical protein PKA95_07170 [Thermomicrobiales bacterium]|nr:hypothetical protein [Thermomicrobiales bacterium]
MSVRIHVMLPEKLVEEIDALVGPRRRSEFIAETMEAAMERERFREALTKAAGSIDVKDYPEWATPEKVDEWVRRSRELDEEAFRQKLGHRGDERR